MHTASELLLNTLYWLLFSDRSVLGKERFILAHSLRYSQFIVSEKLWYQENEAADHMVPTVTKQREINVGSQVALS